MWIALEGVAKVRVPAGRSAFEGVKLTQGQLWSDAENLEQCQSHLCPQKCPTWVSVLKGRMMQDRVVALQTRWCGALWDVPEGSRDGLMLMYISCGQGRSSLGGNLRSEMMAETQANCLSWHYLPSMKWRESPRKMKHTTGSFILKWMAGQWNPFPQSKCTEFYRRSVNYDLHYYISPTTYSAQQHSDCKKTASRSVPGNMAQSPFRSSGYHFPQELCSNPAPPKGRWGWGGGAASPWLFLANLVLWTAIFTLHMEHPRHAMNFPSQARGVKHHPAMLANSRFCRRYQSRHCQWSVSRICRSCLCNSVNSSGCFPSLDSSPG
jgi:hypothetical protein